MIINGNDYAFRRPTLGLLAEAAAFARTASVFNANWADALRDPAAMDRLSGEWRAYCALIFENPDAGLEFPKLTPGEAAAIPRAFFRKAAEGFAPEPASQTLPGSAADAPPRNPFPADTTSNT